MMSKSKPVILFLEDERYLAEAFSQQLQEEGYEVFQTSNPDQAICFLESDQHFDLFISDVQVGVAGAKLLGPFSVQGGQLTGIEIGRRFRKRRPETPIIFWTNSCQKEVRSSARRIGKAHVVSKKLGGPHILEFIAETLDGFRNGKRPRSFIVHGHENESIYELLDFITVDLNLPKPIILREQAPAVTTLIEKLEEEAANIDVVFVLLTPDDELIDQNGKRSFRARPNVLFELGFFLGLLGRHTGCIILLHKKPVDLPSDMGGLVSIDITAGIRTQAELIKAELAEWR